ncbi:uncharacterized protein JCM6883_004539 [Sporobolomyces salmoneus]|uniref:uncharacterized protein n=1 Tax=Sporobolomyces salmoneus TaxID=183962 RepID=UPI003170E286
MPSARKAQLRAWQESGTSTGTATSIPKHEFRSPISSTSDSPDDHHAREDYKAVQALPELKSILSLMEKEHGHEKLHKLERYYQSMLVQGLASIGSSQAKTLARTLCAGSISRVASYGWTLRQVRPVLDVATGFSNWGVIGMILWRDPPMHAGDLDPGRILRTLKGWSGDTSDMITPSTLPPDLLVASYPLHHIIFNAGIRQVVLPQRSPIGRSIAVVHDVRSSDSFESSSTSFSFEVIKSSRFPPRCIVDMLHAKSKEEPGYLIKLLREKGLVDELGILSVDGPQIPVVCDLELDVNVSDNESSGIRNMSIISEDCTCYVVRTGGERFAMVTSMRAGSPVVVKHGGFGLFVDACHLMTGNGRRPLITFSNSRIDERALWDAGRRAGRLSDDRRPRFATRRARLDLPFVDANRVPSPIKIINFGGTLQSLQRSIGLSFWNMFDVSNHFFATPENPIRTRVLDAIDRVFQPQPFQRARNVAEEPTKLFKSNTDVAAEQEVLFGICRLARMDQTLFRRRGTRLLPDDDDDDDDDDNDNDSYPNGFSISTKNTDDGEGGVIEPSPSKPPKQISLRKESIKSRSEVLTEPQRFEAVLHAYRSYGLTDQILREMVKGINPTLANLIAYLDEISRTEDVVGADSSNMSSSSTPYASSSSIPITPSSSRSNTSSSSSDILEPRPKSSQPRVISHKAVESSDDDLEIVCERTSIESSRRRGDQVDERKAKSSKLVGGKGKEKRRADIVISDDDEDEDANRKRSKKPKTTQFEEGSTSTPLRANTSTPSSLSLSSSFSDEVQREVLNYIIGMLGSSHHDIVVSLVSNVGVQSIVAIEADGDARKYKEIMLSVYLESSSH